VTISVQSIIRVISESLDLVEKSKRLDTRLSRCDVVIAKAKELMAYQALGIPTISPPPNQLVATMEERRSQLIAEADEASGGKVPPGVFWADYIKKLKDKPEERLEVALNYLPLPAAFREAAVALRAQIRERRKQGAEYGELLSGLHTLAAWDSFLHATPHVEANAAPAWNVVEIIPEEVWRGLDLPYSEIGHRELSLLNQTDGKWLEEAWGEPKMHRTAQEYHQGVWNQWVAEGVRRPTHMNRSPSIGSQTGSVVYRRNL
jgi:hypothetical protein